MPAENDGHWDWAPGDGISFRPTGNLVQELISGPTFNMLVASFNDFVQLGFDIKVFWSLEGAGVGSDITIDIGKSVNFVQSASHGGSTTTSRHAWKL